MKIRTFLTLLLLAALVPTIFPAVGLAQDEAEPEPQEESELEPAVEPPPEQLAARVNGEDISLFALSRSVNQFVRSSRIGPNSGMTIEQIQSMVLDRVITTLLVEQEGRRLGLLATHDEVEARLVALRSQAGSPEDFRLMLTVQNMTEPELRRQLSQQITSENVIEAEVFAKMRFDADEVQAYYEAHKEELSAEKQIRVSHIFIGLRPEMTDEERSDARLRVDEIKARLDAGESFRELAVALSEDAAAAEGGDLGWISRDQVVGPFQVVAFSTPQGDISDVVATDYGYHIIQVVERRDTDALMLEEVRPRIEEHLREARTPEAVRRYVAELKEKAEIEMFLAVNDTDS